MQSNCLASSADKLFGCQSARLHGTNYCLSHKCENSTCARQRLDDGNTCASCKYEKPCVVCGKGTYGFLETLMF